VNYVDGQVDIGIIQDNLQESIDLERQERKFDRFAQNSLEYFEWNGRKYLACPRGVLLNSLHIYELDIIHRSIMIPINAVLECTFKTAIKQITFRHGRLFVRTYQGIHLVSMEGTDEHDIETEWQPRFMSVNPIFSNRITLISDNGSAHLWDINSDDVSVLFKKALLKSKEEWGSCIFGPHPRSLLLGNSERIDHYDERSKRIFEMCRMSNGDPYTAMKRNDTTPLELALSTKNKTYVMDTRYMKSPLFIWNVNNPYETQFFLEYASVTKVSMQFGSSCLYSWGRHYGETILYCQDGNQLKCSVHVQKLKPFYDHKFFCDPKENISRPGLIETGSFRARAQDHVESPPWPALVGCQLVECGSNLTFFQLNAEGALFAQSYRFQSEDDEIPKRSSELHIDLCAIENQVYSEMKEMCNSEFDQNEEASKIELDFQSIWDMCENRSAKSLWKQCHDSNLSRIDSNSIKSL
jgi:hypothetical protein